MTELQSDMLTSNELVMSNYYLNEGIDFIRKYSNTRNRIISLTLEQYYHESTGYIFVPIYKYINAKNVGTLFFCINCRIVYVRRVL